jgi:hypothetical protein
LKHDTKAAIDVETPDVSSNTAPWWPKMKKPQIGCMNTPNQQYSQGNLPMI